MTLGERRVEDLLAAIGAKTPVPGGGAVASLTAALAAALGRMVVEYSAGRKSLAAHADLHDEARAALEETRVAAIDLAEADARAYGRLNDLWKLPEDDERRARELPAAVRDAIAAPRAVLDRCLTLLELLGRLTGAMNRMLRSDLAIAAILAEAAARAAAWNVRINLPLIGDAVEAEALERETAAALDRAHALAAVIETACAA